MPRRAATVTQADIARTIRAMRQAGLTVARIVVRADGVAIETEDAGGPPPIDGDPLPVEQKREIVL